MPLGCFEWPCRINPHVFLRNAGKYKGGVVFIHQLQSLPHWVFVHSHFQWVRRAEWLARPLKATASEKPQLRKQELCGTAEARSWRVTTAQTCHGNGRRQEAGRGYKKGHKKWPIQCVMIKFCYRPPNTPSVMFTRHITSLSSIGSAASC